MKRLSLSKGSQLLLSRPSMAKAFRSGGEWQFSRWSETADSLTVLTSLTVRSDMPMCSYIVLDVGNITITVLEFIYSTRNKLFRYFVLVTEQGSQSDGCRGGYSNSAFRELLKGFGDRLI